MPQALNKVESPRPDELVILTGSFTLESGAVASLEGVGLAAISLPGTGLVRVRLVDQFKDVRGVVVTPSIALGVVPETEGFCYQLPPDDIKVGDATPTLDIQFFPIDGNPTTPPDGTYQLVMFLRKESQ